MTTSRDPAERPISQEPSDARSRPRRVVTFPVRPEAMSPAVMAAITAAARARRYAWSPDAVIAACGVRVRRARWWSRRGAPPTASETVVAVDAQHLVWCEVSPRGLQAYAVRFDVTSVRDTTVMHPARKDQAVVGGIALHGDLGPLGRAYVVRIGDNSVALEFRERVLALAGHIIET